MIKRRSVWFLVALASCFTMAATTSSAATVTFDLDYEFSGATAPEGSSPWLRAVFEDIVGSDLVRLTMTALNLTDAEHVKVWTFNVNPAEPLPLVSDFDFRADLSTGTFVAPSLAIATDDFKADGDGYFDIEFTFASAAADRFGVGEVAVFDIDTSSSGLTALDFDALSNSDPDGPGGKPASDAGKGPFASAAHVGGIGASNNDSGWIAPGDDGGGGGLVAPEPASLAIWGIGLAGVAASRRLGRSRRRAV